MNRSPRGRKTISTSRNGVRLFVTYRCGVRCESKSRLDLLEESTLEYKQELRWVVGLEFYKMSSDLLLNTRTLIFIADLW
jgi:hypothetical protein